MKMFLNMGGLVAPPLRKVSAKDGAANPERQWECICHGTIHHSPVVGAELDGRTLGICDRCETLFEIQEFLGPITLLRECPSVFDEIDKTELRYSMADLFCPHCEESVRATVFSREEGEDDVGAIQCYKCKGCGRELKIEWDVSDETFAIG